MNPLEFLNNFLMKIEPTVRPAYNNLSKLGGYNQPQDFTSVLSQDNVRNQPWVIKEEIKRQTPRINPFDYNSERYDLGQLARQNFTEPVWLNKVADARSTEGYNNWLKNDPTFRLGGREYRWVESSEPVSSQRIAQDIVDARHRGDNQYVGSYASLINQKRQLTGKNYIPQYVRDF